MGLIEEYRKANDKLLNSKDFTEKIANNSLRIKDKWYKTSLNDDEINTLLNKMNIDIHKDINVDNLFNHLKHDKKKENDIITIVKLINVEKFKFVKYSLNNVFQLIKEDYHE